MANNPAPDQATTLDALKFAKAVVSKTSNNSLTRQAANQSMFIYPMVMCADVPIDDAVPYAKETERMLASLLVALISVNSDFNLEKYMNPSEYLQKFHSNENASAILRALNTAVNQATESFSALRECLDVAIENATLIPDDITRTISPDFVMEAFIDTGLCFRVNRINEEYTPHVATQSAMESIAKDLQGIPKPAMEAGGSPAGSAGRMGSQILYRQTNQGRADASGGAPDKSVKVNQTTTEMVDFTMPDGRKLRRPAVDENGKPIQTKSEVVTTLSTQTGKQGVVRNDRLTGMEPTLVNLQLTGHTRNGTVIVHNVTLAIKVDCRQCTSEVMVSNLVGAVTGSRAIFNFIKWTRGQYGFIKDFIFGVSNAKDKAIGSRDTRQWLASLKRGKLKGAISRLTGETMPPITIIVATMNDVARVQQETGVDLSQPFAAIKMMNAYYMLGFSIIDTATGKVMSIYDGDTDFSVTSINALRGRNSSKETDLSTYVSILRAAGGLK